MSVEAINNSPKNISLYAQKNQPAFTGSFNPVVTLMDAIDRGGFAASFIAQDGIGMVAPRIYEGLNRNRKKDENGKKTGPLNWEFARREGIREVLSGPSAFLIPMGIMAAIKKASGTANNVHVSHINALGEQFADYASKNSNQLANAKDFKTGYYSQVFENVLSNSTDKNITGDNLKTKAQEFAKKLVKSEELRSTKNKKEANKLIGEIKQEFVRLRKANTSASNNELEIIMQTEGKPLHSNINRLTQSLTDYTNDVLPKTLKQIEKNSSANLKEFIKKFNVNRAGTRVFSNLGMWGAVVGFYTLIPKLYNLGLKQDPGLKGLENNDTKNKDVSFTGGFASKAGSAAIKDGKIGKLLSNFEFNGAAMPVSAMLTLLFGFTLPARYTNAKSDKERKEILVRDISSFAAILFGAKALSRGFSNTFAKISGLALNIKPANHKGILNKMKNYISAGNGIEVLSSEQIVTKYSNLKGYKDGINGFFQFLNENGGNVKKVLNIDNTVKAKSEAIMKRYGNKSLKDASFEEINNAFKLAKENDSEALEKIYEVFSKTDNKFINRAKTLNSAFGFASTLILVPAFMMWLARYCEKMTKKAVEKEKAQKAANTQNIAKPNIITNQPTMAGFLNNN